MRLKVLKAIVELILNGYFENFKGTDYLMLGSSLVVKSVIG